MAYEIISRSSFSLTTKLNLRYRAIQEPEHTKNGEPVT